MKKTYVKPEIMFEDFTLTTSIAAGCEVQDTNKATINSCGLDFSGVTVFVEGMTGCAGGVEVPPIMDNDGQDPHTGICYHNPSGTNIFNS